MYIIYTNTINNNLRYYYIRIILDSALFLD